MEIDKKLYEDIKEYCKLNGLKPGEYVNSTLKKAFLEDKYGSAPFLKKDSQEFVMYGNKAFEDAVNAEVKRILNDKEELHALLSAKLGPGESGAVYTEDALREAAAKFNKTLLDGMKEAQETEKEISDYMEKNNLEPVSMEELIYGDDESGQDVPKNVQKPENVQKTDVNLDKKPRKRTIKPVK